MRILFLYRYGILGGVCTQLYHRFNSKDRPQHIEIHCGFARNYGVEDLLSSSATLHFGLNRESLMDLLLEVEFHRIIVIDTQEYIQTVCAAGLSDRLIIETHTSILANLRYLKELDNGAMRGIITVSKYMRQLIAETIDQSTMSIEVFPNVLDCDKFTSHDSESKASGLNPMLTWIGKIDDHKDWKSLIRISELILQKISNLEIVIIGGETAPQERAMELLDFSLESGVIHRLRWIDRVNHDAMVEVYGSTIASRGVILSTSKGESFGMALLEGLLSGAPTVAPRNSAVPELTEESSGFQLYPEGDIESAANICIGLLGESEKWEQAHLDLRGAHGRLRTMYHSGSRAGEYWNLILEL